jgi:glycosyltransferase involved in cell wall biosynthesis
MATYNGEQYIKLQLESILSQLGPSDEVVISDDGSNDNTRDVVLALGDNRIRLLVNSGSHGFVSNFENALRNARGEIIFLSDQDDIWLEGKVRTVTNALKNYDLVVHDALLIDGDGYFLGKTYYSTLHHKASFFANLWKTRWLGCCMAFRRQVVDYCLPIPPKIVGHDYWIGMLGMLKFRYCFMDEILVSYRRHGNNTSPSGEKSTNSMFYKLVTKRMTILVALLKKTILH